ncbi:hypothetical protein ACO0R3_002495 [Hanseniaspora guilliermondii]
MSNDNDGEHSPYEFNYDNISKAKMRSFRVKNKFSKLLEDSATVDGMSSHGTEYDNLKARMREKYLKKMSDIDVPQVDSTVSQLQEALTKTKSILKSLENRESLYLKGLREKAQIFVDEIQQEAPGLKNSPIEQEENVPEVFESELNDEMIDDVVEQVEEEDLENNNEVSIDESEEENNTANTASTQKYQLKYESDSQEEDDSKNNESIIDTSQQQSVFGQVSLTFDTSLQTSNTNDEDEAYEEKMKSIKNNIAKKLAEEAKKNEISHKNKEISKLKDDSTALDEKLKIQNDLILTINQEIHEKELLLIQTKKDYEEYLKSLKSNNSLVEQYKVSLESTKKEFEGLVESLNKKLSNGKSFMERLKKAHEEINSYFETSSEILKNAKECENLFLKQNVDNFHHTCELVGALYSECKLIMERDDYSSVPINKKEVIEKFVDIVNQEDIFLRNFIKNDTNKNFVPSEVNNSSISVDDHESKDNGDEIDLPPLNTTNETDNQQEDNGESYNDDDEDAISKFYRDNNIKEGELLKTIVSQAISEPMEIPETETLSTRQNSVRLYNKLSNTLRDKVSSTISSIRNSIPSTISLKRNRQVASEDDDGDLDEDDIRSIEETFRKRAKTRERKYKVVKMYVKDINKGDLVKHPALTNPEDVDEEIEYVTLVKEKLVTNPTDEVIVISSDDEDSS